MKVGKYTFELSDKDGKFYCKTYNDNAKKAWNRLVDNYYFHTAEQRAKWIDARIAGIKKYDEFKAARRSERLSFVNPAKVGDILYSSWGYDQTNIDFYKVVDVKGKQVVVKALCSKQTEQNTGNSMAAYVTPVLDSERGEALTRFAKKDGDSYQIKINDCATAWMWDGRPKYESWYA